MLFLSVEGFKNILQKTLNYYFTYVFQLTAIENMRAGRISKIFLEFEEPFWSPGEGNINFAWTKQVTFVKKSNHYSGYNDLL